jgi:hypothetical protein
MSQTRRLLCVFYALVALAALVATWSQNLQYFMGDGAGGGQYIPDLKVTASSRSFTVDIGFFLLAAAGFMVSEARKLKVGFVWLYLILGFAIAISVTFPLFMIAREMRLAKMETVEPGVRLTVSDVIGLAVVTAVVLGMAYYILT